MAKDEIISFSYGHENDVISRQMAIDALRTCYDTETVTMDNGDEYINYGDAVGEIEKLPSAQPEQRWIPVTERLPEENHWLGGSGKQFSDEVLVNVANYGDEDTWVYISQTIDGRWALELPRHCEITAWMPLPEPYRKE